MALPASAVARPLIVVNAGSVEQPTSPFLTAVNHMFGLGGGRVPRNCARGAPNGKVVDLVHGAGVKLIRFPRGTAANRYDWRLGVGDGRPPCQINAKPGDGPLSNVYGFDDHMTLVISIPSEDAAQIEGVVQDGFDDGMVVVTGREQGSVRCSV